MTASYQLIKEKLDYNLQVLSENRRNQLGEALNNSSHHKLDQKFKQQNVDRIEEDKRLTKQFKIPQEMLHHFECADDAHAPALLFRVELPRGQGDHLLSRALQRLQADREQPEPRRRGEEGPGAELDRAEVSDGAPAEADACPDGSPHREALPDGRAHQGAVRAEHEGER